MKGDRAPSCAERVNGVVQRFRATVPCNGSAQSVITGAFQHSGSYRGKSIEGVLILSSEDYLCLENRIVPVAQEPRHTSPSFDLLL